MKRTVYIGTEGAQELAAMVLAHTISSTATRPVDVHFLNRAIAGVDASLDNSVNSNTPFSKQRVFVPLLAATGQAAYLDSDMLVFRDINDLFDAAAGHAISSCTTRQTDRESQTSVLVFEVDKCRWDPREVIAQLDRDPTRYRPYLYEFSFAGGTRRHLASEWNDLEHYDPSTTRLLHFTDMDTQPWLTSTNRLGDVWLRALQRACNERPDIGRKLEQAVDDFEVRPSLRWQAAHGWSTSDRLPLRQRLLDVFQFVSPHALANGIPGGWGRRVARLLGSKAPRVVKRAAVLASCILLLARRRRRLLVRATLVNRKCVINRNTQAVLC